MHVATFWQITLSTDPTFLTPVLGLFVVTSLTVLPNTAQILIPLTDYLARATYYDDMGNSTVGPATAFTTLANGTIPFPGAPTVWVDCD